MLDFRLLTFLELCELKSYTKTAQSLNITQPTVTAHIQYLEQLYGVKLFHYEGKKVTITEEGHVLLKAVLTMQSDSKKVLERMQTVSSPRKSLRIGATLTIGEFVLGDVIGAYLEEYPEVELSLRIGNTSQLLTEMKLGQIDCAFVEGYFDKQEFDYRVLMKDEFISICGPSYPGKRKVERLEETVENTVILREEGSGTREILERILHEKSLSIENYQKKIIIGNLNLIKQLVQENRGISFLYRSAVKKELEQGRIEELQIGDCFGKHEYNFVVLKNSIFRDEYFAMFDFMKQKMEYDKS